MSQALLQVENLKVHFLLKKSLQERMNGSPQKIVHAVDGVSFSLNKGETLGIVGESGCGKSTIGKALVRLNPITEGRICCEGEDVTKLTGAAQKKLCKRVQYIFQDPYASLNPQMTVIQIVRRPLDIFEIGPRSERDKQAIALLKLVGIAANQAYRYPHEFSGGQRQRISIARALAVGPEILIADEPTSALDVSIQCQILDLLCELRTQLGLTMIFVSHDLSVVNYISDRVIVMYLGHIIEEGNTKMLFRSPAHPYTKALLEALPKRAAVTSARNLKLEGYIPSPIHPPAGCLLHPRCPYAQPICASVVPALNEMADGRKCACHFAESGVLSPRSI